MEKRESRTEEWDVLARHLKASGGKMTASRSVVLSTFLGLERHVTTEEVLEAVRKADPRVGQATVFRTMRLLVRAGLAREARSAAGGMQYEHAYRHEHHDHLVCVDCGIVIEFKDEAVERAQEAVYRAHGFQPAGHRMELLGRCAACSARASGGGADSAEVGGEGK